SEVIKKLRSRGVQIVAYFSPIPRQIYELGEEDYLAFEAKMNKLFTASDIVINLNEEKYEQITSDYRYYIDHGHLSALGQAFVLDEINEHLEHLKENPALPVRETN